MSGFMVDRIGKLKPTETWKLQGAAETKKDKRGQSDEEKKGNQESIFEEKPDWNRLIAKEGKRETLNIYAKDIQVIQFKGVSTGRDSASLEVDILLKDGTRKDSALISISKTESLKWMHQKVGDPLSPEVLSKDPYLKASVLLNPLGILDAEPKAGTGETKTVSEPQKGSPSGTQNLLENKYQKALSVSEIVLYTIGIVLLFILTYGLVRLFF